MGQAALTCPRCDVAMTHVLAVSDGDVGRCASCGRYYRRDPAGGDYTVLPYAPTGGILSRPAPNVGASGSQLSSLLRDPQPRHSLLREGAEKPCRCGGQLVFRHADERWRCTQCGEIEEVNHV
jgi:ribosomal protein L37AE/L43A